MNKTLKKLLLVDVPLFVLSAFGAVLITLRLGDELIIAVVVCGIWGATVGVCLGVWRRFLENRHIL